MVPLTGGMANAYTEQRPALQIAQQTWDRVDDEKQPRFVQDATTMGYQLTVTWPDGQVWTPDPLLS
jgi:hypothetical protein